jgi:nickel transport protein
MRTRRISGIIYLFLLIVLFPVNSYAHRVFIFAWAENGKIYTESKFSSNKFVNKGKIIVKDEKGNILLNGITTDNGKFVFKIPEKIKPFLKADSKSYLNIILEAGMGHKGEWKIGFDEIYPAIKGGNTKAIAEKREEKEIKQPSFINVSAGILIIFAFFISIAYFKKKRQKNNDRE